jgi:hypothetical protein
VHGRVDAAKEDMAMPNWNLSGRYYETCSCDFVCPCLLGQMAVPPTKGSCTFAMGFDVERGRYGDVSLDGLAFIVLGRTPEVMNKGNWSVGLIADERADAAVRTACAGGAFAADGGVERARRRRRPVCGRRLPAIADQACLSRPLSQPARIPGHGAGATVRAGWGCITARGASGAAAL